MPSLRFVEVNGDKQNIVVLKNLPSQIVGHQGEIKPKISNGHISRQHCTIKYQEPGSWLVIDGNDTVGGESRNGLLTIDGKKVVDKVTLSDPGDRAYILFLHNTSAYLEVFNTDEEKSFITSGVRDCDLDHQLAKMAVNSTLLKGEVNAISDIVLDNKNRIEQTGNQINQVEVRQKEQASKMDAMFSLLEEGLNHVEDVGTKPKVFVTGFLIVISASIMSLGLYGVYRNLDPIINTLFQIEQKK